MGKRGIRIGERVQISGVTGDVINMGMLQFQLREFDVEEDRFTGHVATFSNSLVFVSPAIGLLNRCRRPGLRTNCQSRTVQARRAWFRHALFRMGSADFPSTGRNASTLPRSVGGNHFAPLRKLCGMWNSIIFAICPPKPLHCSDNITKARQTPKWIDSAKRRAEFRAVAGERSCPRQICECL